MTVFLLFLISPLIVKIVVTLTSGNYYLFQETDKQKKYYLFLFGIIMVLMIGLRKYTNGSGDSWVYYEHWKMLSTTPFSQFFDVLMESSFEKGYVISVFMLSHVFRHPQFLFIISGAFFTYAVCRFVYKNCSNMTVALMVFNCLELFIFMVQGLRQAIAMSICLLAIELCKKRKLLGFIFTVVLAMLFHASAIVFIVVYFIPFLKMDTKHLLFFSLGCIGTTFIIPYLFQFVNLFIREDYEIVQDAIKGTGVVTIFIYIAIIIAGFVLKPKQSCSVEEEKDYSTFFYLTCMAFLTFSMRNSVASIAERISFYFAFGQMALVSNSVQNVKNERKRFLYATLIVILCFCVGLHKAGYTSLVPYLFFWQ